VKFPTGVPNTILQNRYRVLRKLDQGGMGSVYEVIVADRVTLP
jgi:hypothetical protein